MTLLVSIDGNGNLCTQKTHSGNMSENALRQPETRAQGIHAFRLRRRAQATPAQATPAQETPALETRSGNRKDNFPELYLIKDIDKVAEAVRLLSSLQRNPNSFTS